MTLCYFCMIGTASLTPSYPCFCQRLALAFLCFSLYRFISSIVTTASPELNKQRAPQVLKHPRSANRSRLQGGNMATTQSSSPSDSPQFFTRACASTRADHQPRRAAAPLVGGVATASRRDRNSSSPSQGGVQGTKRSEIQQLRSTNSRADQERGRRLGHWHCSGRGRLAADQAVPSPARPLLSPA